MTLIVWYVVGASFTHGTFEDNGWKEALYAAFWPVVLPMRVGSAFRVVIHRIGGW